jgi:hypothetical protein
MIDKSIRQHYQTGEKVNQLTKWKDQLMALPSKKITPKSITKNVVTQGLGRKLAGTGLLSSLGPIGALLAMFLARKGVDYASGKIPKDIGQAFTQGFTGLGVGSPEEQRELRVLENRRANMLQRKEEGKNYSEKNLDVVTRAIAEAKGLDINNPNEMRNIDKPIQQIRIEKRVTEPSRVIPKTPEIISPHLLGGDETITPPKISPISYEDDFATETIADIKAKEAEAAAIKQQEAFEAQRREAELQREVTRQAEANAARIRAEQARAAGPHGNGGGGGHHGHTETRSSSGWESSPFKKGGRVDKALGGRVRDI